MFVAQVHFYLPSPPTVLHLRVLYLCLPSTLQTFLCMSLHLFSPPRRFVRHLSCIHAIQLLFVLPLTTFRPYPKASMCACRHNHFSHAPLSLSIVSFHLWPLKHPYHILVLTLLASRPCLSLPVRFCSFPLILPPSTSPCQRFPCNHSFVFSPSSKNQPKTFMISGYC